MLKKYDVLIHPNEPPHLSFLAAAAGTATADPMLTNWAKNKSAEACKEEHELC